MTQEVNAAAKIAVSGVESTEEVLRRYQVGSVIRTGGGTVIEVKVLGDYVLVVFKAFSNAVATVFGNISDNFRGRCTLVTSYTN